MSGVYFLIKDGVVVYVGQSSNVEKRVLCHVDKDFDRWRVIGCNDSKRLEYERRLIKYFKPKFNGETGGKRPGAGRHKREPTIVMRIPVSLIEAVKEIINS